MLRNPSKQIRIMGKIVLSSVGSLAFKTELSDFDSSQILTLCRFINFEITLFPFHQEAGIISM